ncbi:hypothetical protein SAMN05892883_0762 [Jatrophihabitans sp. GAS493]|uniref:hypothetical protein n=1 Tax=Jatrophihabitans sp. GAS493 TaxID=1907575 RepID=UPI000BC02473|nr:hypothetical protein [Jatrophihabitans sp. GAS493]SOD71197.1 hypothetical protein SAMN05892883_0762 [Jatrophihabitans sp. GAS493]
MAPTREQVARDLYTYKRPTVPDGLRLPRLRGLSAVLWQWLSMHEACLANSVGIAQFDRITVVPTTSGRPGLHPLQVLVADIVVGSADRFEMLLLPGPVPVGQREFSPGRYVAARNLEGTSVLIIDDTWTTGAHAQSASIALKMAGAGPVGILCIGRWITLDYGDNRAWMESHRGRPWSWTSCNVRP